MDGTTSKALAAFGFLTVLESREHGLFGGYLVLSPQGRPLEFRCSTPVVASRAQQILYGPTLRPYLLSDVIGQSLVASAEIAVEVILTDDRDMLALGLLRHEAVLHVATEDSEAIGSAATDGDVSMLHIGGCIVTSAATQFRGQSSAREWLEPLAANIHLTEPFDRIRAALAEAQIASQDAEEVGDERAAA